MPSLREEVKLLADHWKLISFRQDIKKRGTPSHKSRNPLGSHQIPLKEKRLRILEMVKSQRDPEVFTVPSVDFQVNRVLSHGEMYRGFTKILGSIVEEHQRVLRLVERQKQLEFQLYMQRLTSYMQGKRCASCHRTVNVQVKYTELVKSNETGDANLALLTGIEIDEGSQRDYGLVTYFFSVLYKLR